MYSQNDEEKYIIDYFGNLAGKFLDIGAYDGIKFSNTYELVQRGWDGIAIEPSPCVFKKLQEHMQEFPNIILENVAIGLTDSYVDFYDSNGDAISSFSKEHADKWTTGAGSKFNKISVKAITITSLFDKHGYDYDFINLDVESINLQIFKEIMTHIDKLTKLKLMCIEHDNHFNYIEQQLAKYGFKKIMQNGENIILGR
jgi:FkbM family methyltransferase